MNLRYFLALLTLIATNSLFSMDFGALLDRTQTEIQKEIADALPANSIALISSDDEPFTISIEAAKQSEMLKNMIGEVQANKIITLSNTSSATLNEIVKGLNALKHNESLGNKKLSSKALLDFLEQTIAITDSFAFMAAANYLDVPPLFHLSARIIAKQRHWFKNHIPSKEFKDKLTSIFGINNHILPFIARYYYLVNGYPLINVKIAGGFTIQDYLNYQDYLHNSPAYIEVKGNTLDLSKRGLISLEGLHKITNINKVQKLTLAANSLNHISNELCQLNQLVFLNLNINAITQIPTCIIQMPNLQALLLSSNQITEIPDNIGTMNQLQVLILDNNKIQKIPDSLRNLNLRFLALRNNQINVIDPTLFTNMHHLEFLRLDRGNSLSEQNINQILLLIPRQWHSHHLVDDFDPYTGT